MRQEFESDRENVLAKWGGDIDAHGARAAQEASESIARSSEWFEQESRSRLQVLVEQGFAAARLTFAQQTSDVARDFSSLLESQSASHLSNVQQQLDGLAGESASRARTQLDVAAETAASSFGEVLRGISDQGIEQFREASRYVVQDRQQELGQLSQDFGVTLLGISDAAAGNFRERLSSEIESGVAGGRQVFQEEINSVLENFRSQMESQRSEWAQNLQRLAEEETAKHHERLRAASDAWIMSSVRRLNEQGQDAVDSLVRSAGQALRESCSQIFLGLADLVKERSAAGEQYADFPPGPRIDPASSSGHHNQMSANS